MTSEFVENKAQEEAIRTLEGPVILISAPGSGKTTTLVRRIHAILEQGVHPANVLMVTFTTAAARDMKLRYAQLFGGNPGITFSTIHALCLKLLRREGWCDNISVLPSEQRQNFLYQYMRAHRFGAEAWDMASAAGNEISVVKNNFIDPETHKPSELSAALFRDVYEQYEAWRKAASAIDYDDMLLLARDMLKDPQIREKYQKQFHYVQVDEFQDVNRLQSDLIEALSGGTGNLCVVGDDDQSIYGFRGCRPEIMLRFEKNHPGTKKILMSTNYRSGSEIVRYAGMLIRNNQDRFEKQFVSYRGSLGVKGRVQSLRFQTKQQENDFLVKQIRKAHESGVPYSEMAVLFRTNAQAQGPVGALSKEKIPYYTTEAVKSIYESFIFSDVMDYVSLSVGIGGETELMNILNHPNRYFREAAFRNSQYTENGLKQCVFLMHRGTEANERWKMKKALESVTDWMRAFGPGVITMDTSPSVVMDHLESLQYDRYLQEYAEYRNMEYTDLQEQMDQLKAEAAEYSSVREWFDAARENIRQLRQESREKDADGVMVTTMHGAKGLEWERVFIVDADEGITPYKKARKDPGLMEEERRLFYVAMTRAKDELQILGSGVKSRFVAEIALAEEKQRKSLLFGVSGKEVEQKPEGTKVFHKVFGKGTIVRFTQSTVTVRFDRVGEKTLTFPGSFLMEYMKYEES